MTNSRVVGHTLKVFECYANKGGNHLSLLKVSNDKKVNYSYISKNVLAK